MHSVTQGAVGTSLYEHPKAPTLRSVAVTFAGQGTSERETSRGRFIPPTPMAGVSTISMVTVLTMEMDKPETYQVTIAMLLQKLRGADAITEAAIVTNLVPLALRASDASLIECIKALSAIARSANPEDPRVSSNAVLAAQTRLGRGFADKSCAMSRVLLDDLLNLFNDKGAQIQTHSVQGSTKQVGKESSARVSELTSQLAALLLPIDAVLAHSNCDLLEDDTHLEMVSNFRDMWFLCTLLGFTSPTCSFMTDSSRAALSRIAAKTPALVLEGEKDYVSSTLEYNSVFRRAYAQAVSLVCGPHLRSPSLTVFTRSDR